jgi:hypothetical protein
MLKWKSGNDFRQQGDLLKRAEWQLNKKSQFTLSQGMLKMWDVEDDPDDEVRTTVQSQIHVTATQSAEEPFVWAQYL